MTVVDQEGRVLGRWNVLDVSIVLIAVLVVPLLYGGYLLFRPVPATLTAIEPARVSVGEDSDVTVRGTNLRPYMRVSFNDRQGRTFMFSEPTTAKIGLPEELPAGIYDVILYDQAQERARLPRAFEVVALPRPRVAVDLIGTFTAVPQHLVARITPELELEGLGQIRQVGKPAPSQTRIVTGPAELQNIPAESAFNIPALIRASCNLTQRGGFATCVALNTSMSQDAVMTVPTPAGPVMFQIDQVRSALDPNVIDVRVRFAGPREVVERLRVGDQDLPRNNVFASGATIAQLSGVTPAPGAVVISAPLRPQGEAPAVLAGEMATINATLKVPVQSTPDGWSYNGQVLKAGRAMVFYGRDLEVNGAILGITVPATPK
jgi:hypothetical protein